MTRCSFGDKLLRESRVRAPWNCAAPRSELFRESSVRAPWNCPVPIWTYSRKERLNYSIGRGRGVESHVPDGRGSREHCSRPAAEQPTVCTKQLCMYTTARITSTGTTGEMRPSCSLPSSIALSSREGVENWLDSAKLTTDGDRGVGLARAD